MAELTLDWGPVRRFVDEAKVRECLAPVAGPAWLRTADAVPYLCLGLPGTPAEGPEFQVYASGWTDLEGVMILRPEPDFPADIRAGVAARGERALRDLLLSFPRGATGLFYYSAPWALDVLAELFDGQPLPAREGYCATPETFAPARAHPVRRLGPADHDILDDHWSPQVWAEVAAEGYEVFAATSGRGLEAFCFHWPVGAGRREVHGLQGVRDWAAGHAEAVFSAATEDVLARGDLATCTANLAGSPEAEVPLRLGYRRFYRVRQFLGIKRGGGRFPRTTAQAFFGRPEPAQAGTAAGRAARGAGPVLDIATVRELGEAAGRRRHGLFAAEGPLLAGRAIADGLPVECLLYTAELERGPEGLALLESAWRAGVPHQRVSGGVMGTMTAGRPLPAVLAVVHAEVPPAGGLPLHGGSLVVAAEGLQNPDNLGLLIRTADAMGADAVVVAGADPLHRQCVRAARGAVGRLPLRRCADLPAWLRTLGAEGVAVLGATPRGAALPPAAMSRRPVALAVGNERDGLSAAALAACTAQVRIPMAPGQDSLNVAVAAGMLLYEGARERLARRREPAPAG